LFVHLYFAVELIFPSSFLKTRTFSSLYKKIIKKNQTGRENMHVLVA